MSRGAQARGNCSLTPYPLSLSLQYPTSIDDIYARFCIKVRTIEAQILREWQA